MHSMTEQELATALAAVYARREKLRRLHDERLAGKGYKSMEDLSSEDAAWVKGPFRKEQKAITKEVLRLRKLIPAATADDLAKIGEKDVNFGTSNHGEKILLILKLSHCAGLEQEDKRMLIVGEEWAKLKFDPPQAVLDAIELPADVREIA